MNKVILMGHLVRDPEMRITQGEKASSVTHYTLAVKRKFQSSSNDVDSDFIRCVAFGKQAEFAEKYFRQGMKIVICGHMQTSSYTNKDGQKVYTTDVVIEEQEFAERKSQNPQTSSNQQAGYNQQAAPAASAGNYPSSVANANGDGFMSIPEGLNEDLPYGDLPWK